MNIEGILIRAYKQYLKEQIIEYFGDGAKQLSCTGKGTICNMGAEVGATPSTFGYDESMRNADSQNELRLRIKLESKLTEEKDLMADLGGLALKDKEEIYLGKDVPNPQLYETLRKIFKGTLKKNN